MSVKITDEIQTHMKRAIQLSRDNVKRNGGPFGAVVVYKGSVIGEGYNQVTSTNDPTAHAEIVAIRMAAQTIQNFNLQGATIYCSCEPCPMCLAAIYWARIDAIYYSNTKEDAAKIQFDDQFFYNELSKDIASRKISTIRVEIPEALKAFSEWSTNPNKINY